MQGRNPDGMNGGDVQQVVSKKVCECERQLSCCSA